MIPTIARTRRATSKKSSFKQMINSVFVISLSVPNCSLRQVCGD